MTQNAAVLLSFERFRCQMYRAKSWRLRALGGNHSLVFPAPWVIMAWNVYSVQLGAWRNDGETEFVGSFWQPILFVWINLNRSLERTPCHWDLWLVQGFLLRVGRSMLQTQVNHLKFVGTCDLWRINGNGLDPWCLTVDLRDLVPGRNNILGDTHFWPMHTNVHWQSPWGRTRLKIQIETHWKIDSSGNCQKILRVLNV